MIVGFGECRHAGIGWGTKGRSTSVRSGPSYDTAAVRTNTEIVAAALVILHFDQDRTT